MQELLAYARKNQVVSIHGWLSPVNQDHRGRQVKFYERYGFEVWLDGDEGSIEWRAPDRIDADGAGLRLGRGGGQQGPGPMSAFSQASV